MPAATKPTSRDQLMALPSLSSSLSSLPQATSLDGLRLHTNFTTTIQHSADSAAKLQKALNANAQRGSSNHSTPMSSLSTTPTQSDPAQLTMRRPTKAKFHV